jgi:hypothetical protein
MKRAQPYRLAWAVQEKLPAAANAALARQFQNADEMFQTLFDAANEPAPGRTPIRLQPGTLLATPAIGALEFVDDGTTGHLYITVSVAGVPTRVLLV